MDVEGGVGGVGVGLSACGVLPDTRGTEPKSNSVWN